MNVSFNLMQFNTILGDYIERNKRVFELIEAVLAELGFNDISGHGRHLSVLLPTHIGAKSQAELRRAIMKCLVPEIAWHNREPVLSAAFQPNGHRLATAGADSHLLIWCIKDGNDGNVSIEILADLTRHQRAVNVVRWSPKGDILASGDDESIIILWKQKTEIDPPPILEQINDQDREIWLQYKVLRGHLEDIYDLSWCPFGNFIVSGSVDNTAIIWDVGKGKSANILSEHKGFVQGVAWDPKNNQIATMSSDRSFRVFDISTKKTIGRNSKSVLPVPSEHPLHGQVLKLFYDDTLQSYFRRLDYSPDGSLIAVPTGLIEEEKNGTVKQVNVAYIYKRSQIKSPVCMMQCGESPSLVARWSPVRYKLKSDGPSPLIKFSNPMRFLLAIATKTAVFIYDTQQSTPLAVISNMHYTRLTDLTWSSDGLLLIASSTDGYCSVIKFSPGELGEVFVVKPSDKENVSVTPDKPKLKTPNKRKGKVVADDVSKETVMEVIDEAAMEAWSNESFVKSKITQNILPEMIIDDPTEDIKMVFEESVPVEVKPEPEIKPLIKTPRRVNFITLSSPKNKKNLKNV